MPSTVKAYTTEEEIRRNQRIFSGAALIVTALLAAAALVVTVIINQVYTSSYKASLRAYAAEYATAVSRQVQGDLAALQTLAQFVSTAENLTDRVVLSRQNQNEFDQIVYLDTDGGCIYIMQDGMRRYSHFNNLPVELQLSVIAAWQGEINISRPYYSPLNHRAAVGHAMPIRSAEGENYAALLAVKTLNNYDNLITLLQLEQPALNFFLLDDTGTVLSCSSNPFYIGHLDNIRQIAGLTDAQSEEITSILLSRKSGVLDFAFGDGTYHLNFMPVNVEGWYLAYADLDDAVQAPVYQSLSVLAYTLLGVLGFIMLAGTTFYFKMRGQYRRETAAAFYDPVTGTCNKVKFDQELLKLMRSGQARSLLLISLRIRDFAFMAQNMGRPAADELQRLVCTILSARRGCLMCCRVFDGQYYVLCSPMAEAVVQRWLEEFFADCTARSAGKFSLFPLIFYAGVVTCSDSDDPASLVNRADFVRRSRHKAYHHTVHFYDADSYMRELSLKQIEQEMHEALQQEQFKLFLQPKLDLATGRVTAAEALVRWIKPDGSMIFPGDFIPLFERNGFCVQLDLYMLRQVCRQLSLWAAAGRRLINISVNQSRLLIFRPDYLSEVTAVLQQYAVPPHYVTIEILESLMVQDLNVLSSYLQKLRAGGLAISMDDFGAGYSSLNNLSAFELDEIKFDKEFLLERDAQKKEKNKLILRSLLQLVQQFKLTTVVEGVESAADAEFLKECGCNLAQGYFINKPIACSEFERQYLGPAGAA